MQILMVSLAYYPYVGGGVASRVVVRELARRGHKVSILTSNLVRFTPFAKVEAGLTYVEGVPVIRFDSMWPDMSRRESLGSIFGGAIDSLSMLDAKCSLFENVFFVARALSFPFAPRTFLWSLTSKVACDVVHSFNLVWSTSFIGYTIAKKAHLPFVITPFLHTYSYRHKGKSLFKVLRGSDAVIVMTPAELEFLAAEGINKKRIHVIGEGIDLERLGGGNGERFRVKYGIPLDDPIVLFVGRKEIDKGVIQLLKSMILVWDRVPNAWLVIIGPNAILPVDLKTYNHALSFMTGEKRKRILDLGVVSEEEKMDALSASDVFAMPSIRESFGIVYLEAWYYRKPVIGALCQPVWDVIDDKVDGFLAKFGDEKDLAKHLVVLLKNEKLRARMGEQGYKKVISKYTSEIVASKLEKVYRELQT